MKCVLLFPLNARNTNKKHSVAHFINKKNKFDQQNLKIFYSPFKCNQTIANSFENYSK